MKIHNLKQIFKFRKNPHRHVSGSFQSPLSSSQPLNPHLQTPHHFLIPRRWHLSHHHHHHDGDSLSEGENIFRLGLAADIGLSTGKAITGYLSGSTAIIADAAHSIADVVLSGVALLSFKAGKVPKDEDHPYGHGKFESLGALGISCMLLATAGGIGWHALDILVGLLSLASEVVNGSFGHDHGHGHMPGGHHHGIDMDHPMLALSMTIVSICVKEGLYQITKRAGERQGSGLMKANAWHHRADAISSVVALIGVGGSILGVKFLDPLAGLVVSGMILKAGLDAGYQSVLELVDAAISIEDLEPIKQTILQVEGVEGCHRLRARRAGSSLYLDVHIEVDPFLSVSAAHGIGENLRQQIHKSHPEISEAFIHIDPALEQQENFEGATNWNSNTCLDDKEIESTVSSTLSMFPEEIEVQRITYHLLQGKVYLQIEVTMPPHLPISEAMEVAEAAEKEILKAAPFVCWVCIQLRLGRPFPKPDLDRKQQHKASRDPL